MASSATTAKASASAISSATATTSASTKEKRGVVEQNTVFVSNLNKAVVEDEVKTLFHDCGEVTDVRLIRTKSGILRGYGYVDFATIEGATKALAMSGIVKLRNKAVKIKASVQLTPQDVLKQTTTKQKKAPKTTATASTDTTAMSVEPTGEQQQTTTLSASLPTTMPSVTSFKPRSVVARPTSHKLQVAKPQPPQQQQQQTVEGAQGAGADGKQEDQSGGVGGAPQKSNADFRKMFGL
eukprot:c5143_g1_i1.p1 GENE.c5143_g1_i1~~c5143_g1_i1.p1  ORF type:complete len:239 (+),score=97.35 c5143_g1_i1:1311-2027(+)